MTPSAKDMPTELKEHILQQIRTQIGDSDFQHAVSQVGEDALIDHVIQVSQARKESTSSKWSRWSWGSVGSWLITIAFWVLVAAFPPVFAIFVVFWSLANVYTFLRDMPVSVTGEAGGPGQAVVGLLVILVLLGLVAAFCIYAVPWLWTGGLNWWQWLSGHFQ